MARTRKRPRAASLSPVALGGEVCEENLPSPFVHYPSHYGTFFAFGEKEDSIPRLCSCSLGALSNFTLLRDRRPVEKRGEGTLHPLTLGQLPAALVQIVLQEDRLPLDCLEAAPKLCHRCNGAAPVLRYCHEMYGGIYKQTYGWYTNLAAFRMGVDPASFDYLEEFCPPEVIEGVIAWQKAAEERRLEFERLEVLMRQPLRPEISPSDITYWHNVTLEEGKAYLFLVRKAARARRSVTKQFEDIARADFGYKPVGEAWISESLVGKLLNRLLPGIELIRHDRPDWLDGLELDFHAPSLKLAVEYQGQQHFMPVEVWGGESALASLKKRDERKAAKCAERGVTLIHIDYTEPLSEDHLRVRLAESGIQVG
jgi:hypothetical protein